MNDLRFLLFGLKPRSAAPCIGIGIGRGEELPATLTAF